MPVTNNQFKNIETKVFSTGICDLDKDQLLSLKRELLKTHNDAKQNNQILERWNSVDSRLSSLIAAIQSPKQKWYTNHIIQFLIALIVLAIGIFVFQPLQTNLQGGMSQQKENTTASHKNK